MAQNDNELNVRIPAVITIKDVITFVSMAVAITLAWGVFGTRLTVAEKELVYQSKSIEQLQKQNEVLTNKITSLESRVRDNEDSIRTLWTKR